MCKQLALLYLLLATAIPIYTQATPCLCLNGGSCQSPPSSGRCTCPSSFLGESCQISAHEIDSQSVSATLTTNYTYFYFVPEEVNYYKMIFNVCMIRNPSKRYSLFYIETEKGDGSLRETPSLFETAKIVLGEGNCTTFSTHYISVKRREDEGFRRIVVGLKVMQADETDKYLNTYFNHEEKLIKLSPEEDSLKIQEITLTMSYEVYLQPSYYGTFIILFTAFVLLVILASFITYLKKKYTMDTLDIESISLETLDLHRLSRSMRRQQRINPEEYPRPSRKNNLHHLDIFMPITLYVTSESPSIPHLLANKEQDFPSSSSNEPEACSICLIEFQGEDQIRTTPCKHRYHRECIDNWCESHFSCPICRRRLDFSHQLHRLYFQFLRNELPL